jgi:hypothetical protein
VFSVGGENEVATRHLSRQFPLPESSGSLGFFENPRKNSLVLGRFCIPRKRMLNTRELKFSL